MTDAQHRRSRLSWPTRTAPATTPAGTHDHAQSNGPLALAFVCIVLLFLASAAQLWFIVARGESRDARTMQTERLIGERFCEFLGLWPEEDPLADLYRSEYDCPQPGRPREAFPPEVQAELGPPPAPPSPGALSFPPSAAAGSAGPVEPRQQGGPAAEAPPTPPPAPAPDDIGQPPEPPASPGPQPTPPPASPPRLLDLEPLTDPVCAVLGLCL